MIRVAIVEDVADERACLMACLSSIGESDGYAFDIAQFETGAAFLEHYSTDFDIVFLDIQMPGLNGMETAREVRRMDSSVIIIFVTNLAQFAISGYEVEALDFILKPVNRYAFALTIRRAIARMTKNVEDYITVKTDGASRAVRISSIRYVEVMGHYVIFHTVEGNYTEYVTLKEVFGRIQRNVFVLCNRSYLINLQHVSAIDGNDVIIGNEKIPISRPRRKEFLSALSDYMGGKR